MRKKPAIDRRQFFGTSLRLASGLSLAKTFGLTAAMPTPWDATTARAATASSIPKILLVWCDGGWDPTMVFDDKLRVPQIATEADAESAKTSGGLAFVDHPNRPAVKNWFETFGDNAAIVNGLYCGSYDPAASTAQMLGAVPERQFRRGDWLSFYATYLAPSKALPHAVIDAPWMPGEFASAAVHLTTPRIKDILTAAGQAKPLGDKAENALLAFRQKAFAALQNDTGASLDSEKRRALYHGFARDEGVNQAIVDVNSSLDWQNSSEGDFVRNGKLAVELFAKGYAQCVSLRCGGAGAWNTTQKHFERASRLYEDLFSGLSTIMDHALSRGVLQDTIVLVMSNRGRAPKLNEAAGKAPWPYSSALLWGAEVAGHTTVGLTDQALRGVPLNPVFGSSDAGAINFEMANVMATMFMRTDVPRGLMLRNVQPISKILKVQA